jgi:hypothetical protein
MSDVRMLKYGFFLQRLVENSVQKESVQNNFQNLLGYLSFRFCRKP